MDKSCFSLNVAASRLVLAVMPNINVVEKTHSTNFCIPNSVYIEDLIMHLYKWIANKKVRVISIMM